MIENDINLLNSQHAIDLVKGYLPFSHGEKLSTNSIDLGIRNFDKLMNKIGRRTNEQKFEIALKWVSSIEKFTIPKLLKLKNVQEKRVSDAPPEGETWGKYLFSPARDDVPYEANTPDEARAFDAIVSMLTQNKHLPNVIAKQLVTLASRGEYTDFLVPDASVFYRGMINLTDEQIANLLGDVPTSTSGVLKTSVVFRPKRVGSSWTTEESVADVYMNHGANHQDKIQNRWGVIMVADKMNNPTTFILNPKKLYTIPQFRGNDSVHTFTSSEVYAVGPVKLSKIIFQKF